mmetsp:Transcript_12711/g.23055  ORF Transcript_12711/g.23055 Transcript_12711/m.23055 type:complete len:350 (+) Transcript_12711:17-1066(+)
MILFLFIAVTAGVEAVDRKPYAYKPFHSFMDDAQFKKIQEKKYVLEENAVFIFRCPSSTEEELKKLDSDFEIFGDKKQHVRIVDLSNEKDSDSNKLAQKFGIGQSSCPSAVYIPRWLSLSESVSTSSFERTQDLNFDQNHLIQWIWHHMDIKGYSVFKSHTNRTVEVFWQDPIHKRDWPSFTLRPKAVEKRNVVLGHQFYLRTTVKNHVMEAKYVVRTTESFLDVYDDGIHWYEAWAKDPDHPEKFEIEIENEHSVAYPQLRSGTRKFERRNRRRLRLRFHGSPALFIQALVGSMVGVMMIFLFIVSTIVRFVKLMLDGFDPSKARGFSRHAMYANNPNLRAFLKRHNG